MAAVGLAANYTMPAGGSFESGTAGWNLRSGAYVVPGTDLGLCVGQQGEGSRAKAGIRAGTQFDPAVTDALIACVTEWEDRADRGLVGPMAEAG